MSTPTPLPSSDRFAVRAALAPLLGDARIATSLTSQLLAGEVVLVLGSRGDWLQVRGEDGYEGWTHAGYLTPPTGSESTWRLSLGCRVRDESGSAYALPLGARIAPSLDVCEGLAISAESRASHFPPHASAIATSAGALFTGASYLWGGVTPWGCDCSGFVQRIFGLHGVHLPRDAWQQASIGEGVSANAGDVHRAGDLLFFSDREDRRVTHVGIALGDRHMAHSSLTRGGLAVERMDSDDAYVARLRASFTGVQRVL